MEKDDEFLRHSSYRHFWTKVEVKTFLDLVREHDYIHDWKTISDKLVSRSTEECEKRARLEYKKLLNK